MRADTREPTHEPRDARTNATPMVLDLSRFLNALPSDVQEVILGHIHRVCINEMTLTELSELRKVNVNFATTFYKRCMMFKMLRDYQPFAFMGVPRPCAECRAGKKYYDFHADFQTPCTLPNRKVVLSDWHRLYALRSYRNDIGFATLMRMHRRVDRGWTAMEARLTSHRAKVHAHLEEQERHLFSIDYRSETRSEHMDPLDEFTPRNWAWI